MNNKKYFNCKLNLSSVIIGDIIFDSLRSITKKNSILAKYFKYKKEKNTKEKSHANISKFYLKINVVKNSILYNVLDTDLNYSNVFDDHIIFDSFYKNKKRLINKAISELNSEAENMITAINNRTNFSSCSIQDENYYKILNIFKFKNDYKLTIEESSDTCILDIYYYLDDSKDISFNINLANLYYEIIYYWDLFKNRYNEDKNLIKITNFNCNDIINKDNKTHNLFLYHKLDDNIYICLNIGIIIINDINIKNKTDIIKNLITEFLDNLVLENIINNTFSNIAMYIKNNFKKQYDVKFSYYTFVNNGKIKKTNNLTVYL